MSKVSITRSKLDDLATAVSSKSGVPLPLTIAQMQTAVQNIPTGGTAAISVVDTTDSHGGTVRTITALDISDTTVIASDVATGKYFYTAQGVKTAGTASGGTPSQTQHSIYFEFSDNTDATITGYWSDSFISSAITATTPTTYNNKTVTLAQLDGTTWYEPANIPIGTQLLDYTKVTEDYAINSSGATEAAEWFCATDYTLIDPSMTFSYSGSLWHYIGFYDSSKAVISTLYIYSDATADPNDSNIGHGSLTPAKIPANAAYVRITGFKNPSSDSTSLIRTA